MKRTPLRRKTPLKAKKGLSRKSRLKRTGSLSRGGRINPRNEERAEERYQRDFGRKADWIRGLCCVACGHHPVDPHHEPPRSRGGTKENLVPLCPGHHTVKDVSRHKLGSVERFREVHGVDLRAEAERLDRRWREREETDG